MQQVSGLSHEEVRAVLDQPVQLGCPPTGTNLQMQSPEGAYDLIVYIKGGKKPRTGWVNFRPMPEAPNVVAYISQRLAAKGEAVERVEIRKCKAGAGSRKWLGIWHLS